MERLGDTEQFKKRNMELEGFDRITAGGFTQIPNVIQNDPSLNLGEKAVYAQFLQYAWHHDYCFPTVSSKIGRASCRERVFAVV